MNKKHDDSGTRVDGERLFARTGSTAERQPEISDRTLERPDDIVGHKTFVTGETGPQGFPLLRHEPLTRAEADAIMARVEQERERRQTNMPDEQAAIAVLFSAWQRLKELGWKEAIYCPKDGTPFFALEAGSVGIHECSYHGEWPTGSWFIAADGDLWPSSPILFKALAAASTATREPHP